MLADQQRSSDRHTETYFEMDTIPYYDMNNHTREYVALGELDGQQWLPYMQVDRSWFWKEYKLFNVVQKTLIALVKGKASNLLSRSATISLSRKIQLPVFIHFNRSCGNMLETSQILLILTKWF
jgi:hypothetical protein